MDEAELALTYLIVVALVALSGVFSGLTLGLLGLDKTGLEIVIGGGSEQEQQWARKLLPLRADGNRLLCTLLVGNVVVNAWLSIFLASLYSSVWGLIASTTLIVVFGEILPQATCSRHALRVGASALPIVRFFLVILAPIAVPLGRMLDLLLGEDVGTVHTRTEMLQYMKVHVQRGELDDESGQVMRGALEMTQKSVVDVMTPLEDVYMLPESTNLSFQTVRAIFEHGFSRVPVFRGERESIVGLLFVKDLIFVDPEDETPLSSLLSIFERSMVTVDETSTLDDVLRLFKRGHGHLALVRAAQRSPRGSTRIADADEKQTSSKRSMRLFENVLRPKKTPPEQQRPSRRAASPPRVVDDASTGEIIGIVTLEDIVEEIIGDEIIDETDVFVDVDQHIRVQGRTDFDFTKLRRLDARLVDERLSLEEIQAVTAHLLANTQLTLGKDEMRDLVRRSRVVDMKRVSKHYASFEKISPKDVMYAKGKPATYATLVLSGKLTVLAGKDNFRSEAGPWSVLGTDALLWDDAEFVPDFTAYVATQTIRLLYISRADYARAAFKSDGEDQPRIRRADRSYSRLESQKERRIGITEKRRQLAANTKLRKKTAEALLRDIDAAAPDAPQTTPTRQAAVSDPVLPGDASPNYISLTQGSSPVYTVDDDLEDPPPS